MADRPQCAGDGCGGPKAKNVAPEFHHPWADHNDVQLLAERPGAVSSSSDEGQVLTLGRCIPREQHVKATYTDTYVVLYALAACTRSGAGDRAYRCTVVLHFFVHFVIISMRMIASKHGRGGILRSGRSLRRALHRVYVRNGTWARVVAPRRALGIGY